MFLFSVQLVVVCPDQQLASWSDHWMCRLHPRRWHTHLWTSWYIVTLWPLLFILDACYYNCTIMLPSASFETMIVRFMSLIILWANLRPLRKADKVVIKLQSDTCRLYLCLCNNRCNTWGAIMAGTVIELIGNLMCIISIITYTPILFIFGRATGGNKSQRGV